MSHDFERQHRRGILFEAILGYGHRKSGENDNIHVRSQRLDNDDGDDDAITSLVF